MSTATEVDVSDLTEFEFATPCQSNQPCDLPAVSLCSLSHTPEGCWCEPVTFCQRHLVDRLRAYEAWLLPGGTCSACQKPIFGGLVQNVRIVRL
jgi:hypothetical protein